MSCHRPSQIRTKEPNDNQFSKDKDLFKDVRLRGKCGRGRLFKMNNNKFIRLIECFFFFPMPRRSHHAGVDCSLLYITSDAGHKRIPVFKVCVKISL